MVNKFTVKRLVQLKVSKYFSKKNKAIKYLLYGKMAISTIFQDFQLTQ
jgi:hypothetical protein